MKRGHYDNMRSFQFAIIFLVPVLLAAALRFPGLAQRPMHCDEAVQADKFGTLLESGRYEYSSHEFHGPTLNYLTLLTARLQRADRYIDIDEVTLRLVPASLGVLLVAAHFLLVPFLGVRATIAGALLAAVSPALVFYSRYYIHETLLVFFSYGALISIWRYVQKRSASWAVAAGAFLGLMWATKETWVIAAVSLLLALPLALVFERWRDKPLAPVRTLDSTRHLVLALLTAVLVSGLLYSSFLTHPGGMVDSLAAYPTYLQRAVSGSWHIHPWNYYLGTLLFSHSSGGPVWTEGSIVGLAILGFAGAMSRNGVNGVDKTMRRFVGFYTLLMVVIYSLIPYKTPWCLLGFLHGMVLLAGAGAVRLMSLSRNAVVRSLILSLLAAATVHLGRQAWAASFRFDSDPRNPYVYAHTGKDVFVIAGRMESIARAVCPIV